ARRFASAYYRSPCHYLFAAFDLRKNEDLFRISKLGRSLKVRIYGTTQVGGAYGFGTVFRMSPNGALTTLLYFDGFNGANPRAPLMQAADGSFYGTTINGGVNGFGTIFQLIVPESTLGIELSGNRIVLSWPSWASDLLLEQ